MPGTVLSPRDTDMKKKHSCFMVDSQEVLYLGTQWNQLVHALWVTAWWKRQKSEQNDVLQSLRGHSGGALPSSGWCERASCRRGYPPWDLQRKKGVARGYSGEGEREETAAHGKSSDESLAASGICRSPLSG